MEQTGQVRIVVTRVSADGVVRRGVIVTDGCADARSWEDLVGRAALRVPPPYEPVPGTAVYHISVGSLSVMVSESKLVGPLRDLVGAVLASGIGGNGRHQSRAPRLVLGLSA